MVCLEYLHRHPSELNLTIKQVMELVAYNKIKNEKEKEVLEGNS
jgi:hypothetical protein